MIIIQNLLSLIILSIVIGNNLKSNDLLFKAIL